jgi:hypothetical protein
LHEYKRVPWIRRHDSERGEIRRQTADFPLAERAIEAAFAAGKEEEFEDGMESHFSRRILSLVDQYGDVAVGKIRNLILKGDVHAEVAGEALRWLGRMEHPPTYWGRRSLLEDALSCAAPLARDGAVLGLAFMDDPHAMPYLRKALSEEPFPELRGDMQQVKQLVENGVHLQQIDVERVNRKLREQLG